VPGFPAGIQDLPLVSHLPLAESPLFRVRNPILVAGFLGFIALFAEFSYAQTRAGLWVEAEGKNKPFESPENYKLFLNFIGDYNFSDYYVQVYREGRSWFPSKLVDDSAYRSAHAAGFDPLGDAINVAHRQGKRIHAWINVLRIASDMSSPGLKLLGKNAVLIDNFGNSLLSYDPQGHPPGALGRSHRLDTPGIWLDASSPAVRQLIVKIVEELLEKYPTLDGIHLDMIRFPYSVSGRSLTFPYGADAEARFRADTGRIPPRPGRAATATTASLKQWDEWRRQQITRLVFEVQQEVKSRGRHILLTAAVVAAPDRSESFTFQNWRQWVRSGAVDAAMPMNYTRELPTFESRLKYAVTGVDPSHVRMGIGAWLFLNDPDNLVSQIRAATKSNVREVTYFSYSNLLNARGAALLKKTLAQFDDSTSRPKRIRLVGMKPLSPPTDPSRPPR